jgi:hypothetical protein
MRYRSPSPVSSLLHSLNGAVGTPFTSPFAPNHPSSPISEGLVEQSALALVALLLVLESVLALESVLLA